jgi:hypothetical protein
MDWKEFDIFSASDFLGFTPPLSIHKGPGPDATDYNQLLNHPLGSCKPEGHRSASRKPPLSAHAALKESRRK